MDQMIRIISYKSVPVRSY